MHICIINQVQIARSRVLSCDNIARSSTALPGSTILCRHPQDHHKANNDDSIDKLETDVNDLFHCVHPEHGTQPDAVCVQAQRLQPSLLATFSSQIIAGILMILESAFRGFCFFDFQRKHHKRRTDLWTGSSSISDKSISFAIMLLDFWSAATSSWL